MDHIELNLSTLHLLEIISNNNAVKKHQSQLRMFTVCTTWLQHVLAGTGHRQIIQYIKMYYE